MQRFKAPLLQLLVAGTLATGCAHSYELGSRALQSHDYEAARQYALEGLSEDPDDPMANLLMARVLADQEQYHEALPYAQRAWDAQTLVVDAGRVLGKVHWELGRPVEAVEVWRATRAHRPDSVLDSDYQRALEAALGSSNSRQHFQAALELRTELAALAPDHPEASDEAFRTNRELLAQGLVQDGRVEQAIAVLGALADEHPERTEYAFSLGELFVRIGDLERAAEAWQRHIDALPDAGPDAQPDAQPDTERRYQRTLEVARRAEQLGAPALAVDLQRQALSLVADAEPTFRRAQLQLDIATVSMAAGNPEASRPHVAAYLDDMRQLRGLPLPAEVYVTAADRAMSHDYPELAFELLEEALVEAPPSWRVAQTLAELYARRARNPDVERVLGAYIERADSTVDAELHSARWAAQRRNHELARHYFERAVARDSSSRADIWLELARIYATLNIGDELTLALENFVRERRDDRQALIDAASILAGQRMYPQAEKLLVRAVAKDPGSLVTVDLLANLYGEWGKPGELHALYDRWIKARGNRLADLELVGDRFLRRAAFDDARGYFLRAARAGQLESWLRVADIDRRLRRDADMRVALEHYLAAAPDRSRALREVLPRYQSSSLQNEAVNVLRELVRLEPHDWNLHEHLAELYFDLGREREAFALVQDYLQRSDRRIETLEQIARRFEQRGRARWLLGLYRQLLRAGEADARIHRLIGDAYLAASLPDSGLSLAAATREAERHYERYLKNSKPNVTELRDFANSMRQKHMWVPAAEAYRLALVRNPPTGQTLLHYGTVLLHLGQNERADELFAAHFEMRGKNLKDAGAIAEQLMASGRFEAAEPYLQAMFESDDPDQVRMGFTNLAELYRHTDRLDEQARLVTAFLSRSQNPVRARQAVLTLLENTGQWDGAVDQLTRMAEVQGDAVAFALGVNQYRAGRLEDAAQSFARHAANSPQPAEAWLVVGHFYEARLDSRAALRSYDQALSHQAHFADALLQRGRLRARMGDVEGAIADYELLSTRVDPGIRGDAWGVLVETLLEVGRHRDAADVARRALAANPVERDVFLGVIAHQELDDGDPISVEQTIARLREDGIALSTLVEALIAHSHLEAAARVIEDEIRDGDQETAGQVLLTYSSLFIGLGGFERLMDAARPLLDPPRAPDMFFIATLGSLHVRGGELERGVMLLHQAVDMGANQLLPLLAHTYAMIGDTERAMFLFQQHLASVAQSRLSAELHSIALRFEFLGEVDAFVAMLHHLVPRTHYASAAAPLLAHYMLDDATGPAAVFGMLRRSPWMHRPDDAAPTDGNTEAVDADAWLADVYSETAPEVIAKTLAVVAGRGFVAEALDFVASLPAPLREHEVLERFVRRLALGNGDAASEAVVARPLEANDASLRDASLRDANERLAIARDLLAIGRYDDARTIADALADASVRTIARDAFELQLATARASGRDADVPAIVERFVAAQSDKLGSRVHASDLLDRLGYDALAGQLRRRTAADHPTETNLTRALATARQDGHADAARALAGQLLRVADSPGAGMNQVAHMARSVLEPELVAPLLEPFRDAMPAVFELMMAEAAMYFALGDVEEGRAILVEHLDALEWQPLAVEQVVRELVEARLFVEAARFIGPRLADRPMTSSTLRELGLANAALHLDDDARELLERYVSRSADPAAAATTVALSLAGHGRYDLALGFAERVVALAPDRPAGYLERAVARLGTGDVDGARADLERVRSAGLGRHYAYRRIATAALASGHEAVAHDHLDELARIPELQSEFVTNSFRYALSAFDPGRDGAAASAFIMQRFPRVAAGRGITTNTLATLITALLEAGGQRELAYAVYEDAIAEECIRAADSPILPTYLNNLAYTFSTTDRHVDRGLDLVRRAMATHPERSPSFIDTLGWLHYRSGDLEAAEREIRRALRSSSRNPAELAELYAHLAELLERQGRHDEAIWMRILVDRLK